MYFTNKSRTLEKKGIKNRYLRLSKPGESSNRTESRKHQGNNQQASHPAPLGELRWMDWVGKK
jgi:hypothetical protein